MIVLELRLGSLAVLRELQRGAKYVAKDLAKREKQVEDADLPIGELVSRKHMWDADDDGIIAQLDEQIGIFSPAHVNGNGNGTSAGGQVDAFSQAPVHNDPNPRFPAALHDEVEAEGGGGVELLDAEGLRDLLSLIEIFVPAAIIRTWTAVERETARVWAAAMHLQASDHADVEVPEQPAHAVSTPLPEPWVRDENGIVDDPGGGAVTEEVIEAYFAERAAETEAAALAAVHEDQPWAPIVIAEADGDTPPVYRVLHRVTRERREVDATAIPMADWVALPDHLSEVERAEATATAFALYLSHADPEGAAAGAGSARDTEEMPSAAADGEPVDELRAWAVRTFGERVLEALAGRGAGELLEFFRAGPEWEEYRDRLLHESVPCLRRDFEALEDLLAKFPGGVSGGSYQGRAIDEDVQAAHEDGGADDEWSRPVSDFRREGEAAAAAAYEGGRFVVEGARFPHLVVRDQASGVRYAGSGFDGPNFRASEARMVAAEWNAGRDLVLEGWAPMPVPALETEAAPA